MLQEAKELIQFLYQTSTYIFPVVSVIHGVVRLTWRASIRLPQFDLHKCAALLGNRDGSTFGRR